MITTITSITIHNDKNCFSCDKDFQDLSLSNFQICNTVLLTTVTVLYITSLWHLFYNWKFVPFDLLHLFHPPPASGDHQSVLCLLSLFFLGGGADCVLFV